MIVKKAAVRNNIKFTRVPYYLELESSICEQGKCIYNDDESKEFSICNDLCEIVYSITKADFDIKNFGYVVKEKID